MSSSSAPQSAAALLSTPVLPVSWPSMGALQGQGGQWMRALEESGRVVTHYQQAHNWQMALASSGLGSSLTGDEEDSAVAPRSENAADQPASGSGGGASESSSGNAAEDGEDADAGSSAELALDTELQTAAFLISSGAPHAPVSSSDPSSPSTPAPAASLHIPARLTNQWTREVRDSELAQSSFGSLYDKRMHVLRSLFASFARHESQQLAREAQESQSLHNSAASPFSSNNLYKRPYSTAQQDAAWNGGGGGGFGKQQQQQQLLAATNAAAAQDDLVTPSEPAWTKLAARDPSSDKWGAELSAQQEQLAALTPLQLRKEYTQQSELAAWFAAAEASLLKFNDDASVGSALASIIGVSVSSGWPSLLLGSVRLLLRIAQDRPAVRLPASAAPHLAQLCEYQNHLDISAPFQSASQFALNQPLPSQMPQQASAPGAPGLAAGSLFAQPRNNLNAGNSSAQGLATDGTYLYVHTRDGLEKIGSGFLGSVRGQRYAYRPDYRNAELVRLAAVGGKIYALSSRMAWPRVEVLSAETLASEGLLQLGIDPEFSAPAAAAKATVNHLMTDGRLLYLLSAEEGDESVAEATAAECAEQILALLNELESAKKSEVQVADLDAAKTELQALMESLQTATEERLQATKLESFTSPRRKMAAAAQQGKAGALETKTRLPPAFGARNNSQTKPAAVSASAVEASSSSTPAKAPAASAFVTPRKEPAFLKKVREAQALTTQLLAATRAANSAGTKTPSAPVAPQGSPVGAGHFIYPQPQAAGSSSSSSIQAKAFRLLGLSGLASASGAFAGPVSPMKMEVLSSVMDKSSGGGFGGSSEAEKLAASLLAAQQAALVAAGGVVVKPKKKQFVKLSLWVYDPALVVPCSDTSVAEDLFLTQEETEQRLAEAEVRASYARQIAESFNYAYSVRLCITALKRCNDDRNNACRWLLENGEEHRALSCVPLVRSLVIANNHPQLTADYLMQGVSCYVTCSQLVMIIPPHSAPWTTDERSLVRVLSLEDGLLFEESRTPNCGRAGSYIAFDARNNLLWSAVLQHSVSVTAYMNHGPSAAVIAIPSAADRAPETPATLTSDTVLARSFPVSSSSSASSSSASSSSSALDAPAEVALFLLAHMDRSLKHRDISSAAEMPLLEHRRAQVQALSMQLDAFRSEVESLSKAKSAAAEASAMLDALPSMAALDAVEVNEFPASPVGSDIEALLGALLSGERSALAALVDRRGGNNSVSRQQSSSRKFPQAVAQAGGFGSSFAAGAGTGGNGGRAIVQPEQASQRLSDLQARILLSESQLAAATASMVELEARQASSSFCPRAPTQPYCLEVADSMFSSLFSLMDSVREGSKAACDSAAAAAQATANYTTEVCLRLLRVHLELLIKYTGHAANSTPIITRSRELRGLLLEFALSEDATPASSAASTLAASSTSAACAAQAQAALSVSLKALACSVLISGIKIFYPSQNERVKLLTGLIAEFQSGPPPQPQLAASAGADEEKKEEESKSESSSSSSSSSAASAAAPVNKKMELLQGIMQWFGSQWSLSDILLVNKETSAAAKTPSSAAAASASTPTAAVESPSSPTAAAADAPTVDTGAFIRSLIDFSLTNEFASFRESTRAKHSAALGKPAGTPGASTVISIPPYPPALSLLLVLQQDLIRKSGLLCIPSTEASDAASAALQRAQAQAKASPFGKAKTSVATTGKKSFIPLSASAPAAAPVSDDLPAGGPQLVSSDSSSVNASIWGGLSLQLQPGAVAAAEEPFEVAALADSASAAPQQASVLNQLYFEKLMDYTSVTMDRCEALIDELRAEEISLGGLKRPSSCVSFLCKNSILVLLPALLTSLGSPAFGGQANAQAMALLPALQSLLTKLDAFNSVVPALRQEDAKYSRLLANEHTRSYVFETPHPYPSGFRVLKQTLSIPGANFIRFTFDPRSSSAGGNDSLRLFSDAAMTKPVGSVLYGNDRDGNATWPRNSSILTPGDTVTLCFSARAQQSKQRQGSSGSGDPSLRFGFKCVARGVFIQTMPWLLDLQHTVSGLMGRVIQAAVSSVPVSINEMQAREWFKFGLMNRGLEDALQRLPASATATPMLAARGLESRPALLSLAAKSPALAYLDRFIDGSVDTRALWAELDRTNVSFAGKLLVKRLPAPLQDQWNRALRATMAAMIKHAGLTDDVYSVFCEGMSSGSAAGSASSAEHKSSDSLGNLSSRARALLLDRLKLVSSSSKSLQNWMMEQVQAHNEWNAWFSPARMTTTFVTKKDRQKEAAAKLRALADAQASIALAAALADVQAAEERLAAASAGADDDFAPPDDEEDMHDYSDHTSEEDEDEERLAPRVRSVRKVAASPKMIKRPASASSVSVSASPPSASSMGLSRAMDEESKSASSEEQKVSDDVQLALAQSLADAGFKPSEPSPSAAVTTAPVVEEKDEGPPDLVYSFSFGLPELKEEYDQSQASKVKALCSIKRIRLRNTGPDANIDLDEALSKLLVCLERERREKQLHGRLHPAQAFHTLDQNLIKQNSYALVIDQVYAMARALLCFKSMDTPSSLTPPMSPGAVSPTAAADSDDMPDGPAPGLGRAVSEFPGSNTHLLPPGPPTALMSRTLSREVPRGGGLGGVSEHASHAAPEERAEELRNFVNTYSRWQSWQSAHQPLKAAPSATVGSNGDQSWGHATLQQSSPLDAIKNIVRANLDSRALVRVALAHQARAQSRRVGFEALARALDSASFEVARVNLVGLLPRALQLSTAPESDSVTASPVPIANSSSLFSGMETASVAAKAAVQDAYEALLQVLLSLLKPSVIRSPSSPLPVLPVPSAHSALFTDAYVSPPRRNCYASRLLALTDIFAFPFSPLRLAASGSAVPASSIPVAASAASALSLSGASLSHLVPSSRRHLFGLLTDALSVSRYLRRLEPSIAEEVARDHLTLQMMVEREVALDRSEMEIRQAQEILNKQVAEDKIKREQQKIRDEEAKAAKLAEAARIREERAARKAAEAAEAAAGGGAAAAAAAVSADDEDALLGAMNLFDSDSDSGSPAAPAPAGLARSVSDEERAARVAEQTARAEAEYLASLQRQFGDGSDQSGQNGGGGAFGGGRGQGYGKKAAKSGLGEPVAAASGLGLGRGADDGSESGHMTVVQNRHGQSRSVWVKGDGPSKSSPSKDRARKERSSAALGGSQEEEEEPEEEDDVPLDDESSADGGNGLSGSGAEKKSESSAGTTLPTIAELNSAFATKEWAALRLSIVQLLQWSEARVRAELASETESTRTAVLLELRSLRTSVLRQLTRELIAALDLARTLSRHHHSWHLRSKLLELLEQLLQLFLLISPVAFAAAAPAMVRSSAPDAPAMQSMQQQLAITLLFLVQEHAALTPRITLLALRLARRVLPALDSDALWRSFVGQATTATSAESAAAAPPVVGSSLAEWLVQRIGALLTAESLAEHQKRQEAESNKRAELKAQAEAKRKQQADAKAAAAAASAAAAGVDAPSADKSEPSPTSPAVSSVKFLPKTHSLVAHFNDGFTAEQWATLLAQPAYIELAYGVRGVLPPKLEDVKLRAASEFERRQKLRKGPAKVACQPKSGSLEQTAELRISSRSGFSTFVGNVGVTGGKWCYQVQLATRGLLQIGWATAEHNPSSAEGQGTGDDVHSWAYDGMRLKRWHVSPAPYSVARWNAGDIVTCLLDLDVAGGEMSFMLNGENHGVAFKGFYNAALGPIYPAASISASETATWIFDAARFQKKGSMKTRVPDGYATLEGDRITYGDPVPASRAAEVHRALEFAGHFHLLEADLAHCEQLARSLAAEHGCILTVQPIDGLDSLSLTDATTPNDEVEARSGSNAYPKQVQTGAVAYAFASELIAFCRFLLDASKSEPAWATQMQSTLRQALHASPQLLQSEAALAAERVQINTLLGALCVLGGFTESVRVGGLIRVASSGDAGASAGSAAARGLVVQANEHANHIRAIYLQELMQATQQAGGTHSVESLSHRLAISQVIAVPELQAEFSLDAQTFVALQKRIEAALPPPTTASSSALVTAVPMPSASAIAAAPVAPENRSQYRWLLGELKWRSVAVLESLLTSVAPLPRPLMRAHSQSSAAASASSSSSGDDMLIRIGELLVSHSRACRLELKLDNVTALSERLSQKAWDLRNVVDAALAPVPFRRRAPIKSGPPANAPHANSFDTVYSSSSYREEKIAAPVADDALLRYWEKYIIPGIQNYVKGSFKPYEMENFFAQLRQPLRANNQAGAVEIAMTLTGGHIPDGMQFPDDSRDFLTLTLDDVRIGACYQVSPAAANSDLWIEAMDCTINMVGTAKAVHVGEELVLLQFYQPSQALLFEWWYPVEALKLVKSARNVQLSHLRDINAVVSSLEETQSCLSALIARRAIFSLVARGGEACTRFLQHQLDAGGLEPVLDWLFLSVSEGLELSDLNRLGQASGNQREALLAFQSNLIAFLNAQRQGSSSNGSGSAAASTGSSGSLSSSHLLALCLKKFKSFISQAASFTKAKSITSAFQIQPPASPVAVVPGSPPPRSNEAADHWQHLHIDHASALVILFSKDTRLSKGSMLSLYPDESASELIKSYAGREESPQLTPLVASGGDVYLHCTQPQDISARSSLKILPISSFLPLAFWLVDLLLNARTSISSAEPAAAASSAAASSASSSSSPPPSVPASSSSSSGDWSAGFEDGGLVGLCYTLCEIILENYALSEIAPSPLKEALLKLVSSLISTITTAKHAEMAALNTSATSSAPMLRPAMQRQISEAKNASQARTLSILRHLHSEMVALYQSESINLVFTSYLQQLVDLLAASDELRPNSDRLCSKFEFAAALSPEEAAAKAAAAAKQAEEDAKKNAEPEGWICGACTFQNAEAAPGCDMCGSAKPKGGAKKAAAGADASSSSSAQDSSQMFHDMMSLVGAMRLLNGEVAVEESPACMAMMEACWRDARRDAVDKRLVIIENVPAGDKALVAAALAKALRALDGTIRLDSHQIFIGTDPTKPPIKEPVSKEELAAAAAPGRDFLRKGGKGGAGGAAAAAAAASAAAAALAASRSSNSSFTFKALGDENGVLYHLGALAKLETNQPKWVNPATTAVVLASASSTDAGCDPVSSLAGRESKRFATKNLAKSWVGLEFVGYTLSLKKYTLRHAETPKTEALRGWKLEGSKDGRKWVVLDERKNDQNLSAKGVCYAYDIRQSPVTKEPFSHFRLTSTQPNSGNTHTLALGNIELYGTLKKGAEKLEPIATPHYAVIQLNSAIMDPASSGGVGAAPVAAASSGGAKPGVPAHQALLDAIKQLCMPLHIRPAPPVDPVEEARKAAAKAVADRAAAEADRIEALERAAALAAQSSGFGAAPPSFAFGQSFGAPAPAFGAPQAASSPFGMPAAPAEPASSSKPVASKAPAAAAAAAPSAGSNKKDEKKDASKDSKAKPQAKEKPKKSDSRSQAELEAERVARQRASDERRAKVEADKIARAQREREEEAERLEAAKHVQLGCIRWTDLPRSGDARSRHPIVNAFLRSKLVSGIEAELRGPNPAQPLKAPGVKSWGAYRPTAEFAAAVTELVVRHAGPAQNSPSLRGTPALDSHALQGFLSYAKLETQPALEKEVALMRKQASLPTGLELELILQILCKIAGAPQVFPLPPAQGQEPVAETPVPSLSLAPPPEPSAAAADMPQATILPPQPDYDSGAFLLCEWLTDAGYDLNCQHHVDPSFHDALRFQQPGYWISQGQVQASRKAASVRPAATTTAATATGTAGASDASEDDCQPVLAEEFVQLLHELADRVGEKEVLAVNPTQIILDDSDWARISVVGGGASGQHPHLPLPALRLRYSFLRLFNRLFSTLLPLIDLRRTVDARSIAGLVSASKPFLFPSVKNRFLSIILDATAEEGKLPQISVNRLALQMSRNMKSGNGSGSDGGIDFLSDTLFARSMKQVMKIDPFQLRPVRPAGTEPFLSFEVQFRGEQVVGEGGPFRQLFNDLGRELMDHSSPNGTGLLQPTPNNLAKVGDDRDKFCIRPSANSAAHLQCFQYLGLLFGCCLRTGVRFPLELSKVVWASILGEELTPSDLRRLDASASDSLSFIDREADASTLLSMNQSFTTKLSDGALVELRAGGEEEKVDLGNRREYVGLVVAARLVESAAQIDAIRRGIAKIVPIQLLNLLTPLDLELLICGRNSIDIDLLRRHTKLSAGIDPAAPHIDYFWQALSEMDQYHRRQFIKFTWAQERLPLDDAEFIRTHTRLLIKPSSYPVPDMALPRSDTTTV